MEQAKNLVSGSAKKAFSWFEEFKNFAFKGNVIDLAVGVIIGAAFGKIVDSLVKQVIMPAIGMLGSGDVGFKDIKIGQIEIGMFLAELVNFLIVALALWIFLVKFLGFLIQNKAKEEKPAPAPTRDQELLTEIRDLLKARQG